VGDSLVEKKAVNSNGLTAFFIKTIDSVSPATGEFSGKARTATNKMRIRFLSY
jgi:hypothetical protein